MIHTEFCITSCCVKIVKLKIIKYHIYNVS